MKNNFLKILPLAALLLCAAMAVPGTVSADFCSSKVSSCGNNYTLDSSGQFCMSSGGSGNACRLDSECVSRNLSSQCSVSSNGGCFCNVTSPSRPIGPCCQPQGIVATAATASALASCLGGKVVKFQMNGATLPDYEIEFPNGVQISASGAAQRYNSYPHGTADEMMYSEVCPASGGTGTGTGAGTGTGSTGSGTTGQYAYQDAYAEKLASILNNLTQTYKNILGITSAGAPQGDYSQSLAGIIGSLTQTYKSMLNNLGANTTVTTPFPGASSNTSINGSNGTVTSGPGPLIAGLGSLDECNAALSKNDVLQAVLGGTTATGLRNMLTDKLYVNAGATINYVWCSKQGLKFSSSYTIDSPDTCPGNNGSTGPFPWVASSASGQTSAVTQACQGGHTYSITYTVKGGPYNLSYSDTLDVQVIPVGGQYTGTGVESFNRDVATVPSPINLTPGSSATVTMTYDAIMDGLYANDGTGVVPTVLNVPAGVTYKVNPSQTNLMGLVGGIAKFSYTFTADSTATPGEYSLLFTLSAPGGGPNAFKQFRGEVSAVLDIGAGGSGGSSGSPGSSSASLSLVSSFKVGQDWTLKVSSNMPNTPFTLCGTHDTQVATCAPNFGTTDRNGSWTLLGTFTKSDLGSWSEWVEFPSTGAKTGYKTFTVQ